MKLKRIFSIMLATLLLCTLFAFAGCRKDNSPVVMTVSTNPAVEFVLDANGNVVTVNACNEEGNLIVSAQAFDVIGKSADVAVQLFVQVCKDSCYLVSGTAKAGDNQIEVSFAGNASKTEQIWTDVQSAVQQYLQQNNLTATLKLGAEITNQKLQQLVAEAYPYLKEKVADMGFEDLVDHLEKSRKETAGFCSQQLKTAYYEHLQLAYDQATSKQLQQSFNSFLSAALTQLDQAYTDAVLALEATRYDNLISQNSVYQKALASFRQAKAAYLKLYNQASQMDSVSDQVRVTLDNLLLALNNAELALKDALETCNTIIEASRKQVTKAYNAILAVFQGVVRGSDFDKALAKRQSEELFAAGTTFVANHANDIATLQQNWTDMFAELSK